jgi:wyosine [tRNA(Phe)-imidazoG37] synthetase (radical SAM superfamily)
MNIAFGPVPSRRFGMSLGVNNVFRKTCSYSCIYCQVGRTDKMTVERKRFFSTKDIISAVKGRIETVDEGVDVITFVPDGEPTLDLDLGKHIGELKEMGIDIAVITNGSMLWRREVREDLLEADIVSVKIDSVIDEIWRRIDRPFGGLELERILDGISSFSEKYQGRIWTETMLAGGVNDDLQSLEMTASFIRSLDAERQHITVPIRPPAEDYVKLPDDEKLALAYAVFTGELNEVSMVTGKEEGSFGSTGELERDLLSTCSVHPMREDSVIELLRKRNGSFRKVQDLVDGGDLKLVEYGGFRFYITSS